MPERSWLFRSVGWGHDELEWKRIVSALRLAISIEHEDALVSVDEGLSSAVKFLTRVSLSEMPKLGGYSHACPHTVSLCLVSLLIEWVMDKCLAGCFGNHGLTLLSEALYS